MKVCLQPRPFSGTPDTRPALRIFTRISSILSKIKLFAFHKVAHPQAHFSTRQPNPFNSCGSGHRPWFSSVQSLSHSRLFATPWTAARQASLSIANSQSLLKLMSIESVMPSNHLILCHSLLLLPSIFPSIKIFSKSQFFTSGGQSIGVSASASVFPMNIQD